MINIKQTVENFLHGLPFVKTPNRKVGTHVDEVEVAFPLGHYYSPIPSQEEILKREKQIFDITKKEIDGVDLNEKDQLSLLREIKKYYDTIPFEDNKKDKLRYYFNNEFYGYSDAIFLYCLIRHFQPKQIIEVGSGFSSAVMLDTIELFLSNKVQCYFIDPYPQRLLTLLNEDDKKSHTIVGHRVQDVDSVFFEQLKENDILFIDSSHVSKTGSDVNYILFSILPNLNSGVLVHFHDIFYPFEYPREWVLMGRGWNEDYIMRAFLQFNSRFKIILFTTFLVRFYEKWFQESMPLCLKNPGGGLWLRKL
jgi:predicted O-methyltransferase YrrM